MAVATRLNVNGNLQVGGILNEIDLPSYSISLNGTADYVSVTDNVNIQLSTGDFTVEGWFYATSVSGQRGIIAKGTNTTGWELHINGAGGALSVAASNTPTGLLGTTVILANTWYHFAFVRIGSATGNIKLYLNGSLEATSATAITTDFSQTDNLLIGNSRTVNQFFAGYISNIRVIKGTGIYSSNFTLPTVPLSSITNTVLLTAQSRTNVDNSSNNLTMTTTGNPTFTKTNTPPPALTPQRILPTGELQVAGIFDEVSLGVTYGSWYFANSTVYTYNTLNSSATGLQLSANSTFTIEFWFYPTSDNVAASFLFCGLSNNATANADTFYFKWASTNIISFISQGTPSLVLNSSASYPTGAWHHIAVTVDTTATANFFVNGILQASGAFPNPPQTNAGVLMFNNDNAVAGHSGGGTCFISNARFITGTDNTAVLYTKNFTPQTPPFTNVYNTVALFRTPNSAAYQSDSSVNSLALTNLNGGGRSSAFNPFIANAAVTPTTGIARRITNGGNLQVAGILDEYNKPV